VSIYAAKVKIQTERFMQALAHKRTSTEGVCFINCQRQCRSRRSSRGQEKYASNARMRFPQFFHPSQFFPLPPEFSSLFHPPTNQPSAEWPVARYIVNEN